MQTSLCNKGKEESNKCHHVNIFTHVKPQAILSLYKRKMHLDKLMKVDFIKRNSDLKYVHVYKLRVLTSALYLQNCKYVRIKQYGVNVQFK